MQDCGNVICTCDEMDEMDRASTVLYESVLGCGVGEIGVWLFAVY